MGNGMISLQPTDDRRREAQYGRFASNVLRVLREAVDRRVNEGETKASLAAKLGWNRSQLSRLLNGNVGNITIKSISDILWAARFEPEDLEAMAYEDISPNYVEVLVGTSHRAAMTVNVHVSTASIITSGGSASSIQSAGASGGGAQKSKFWVVA